MPYSYPEITIQRASTSETETCSARGARVPPGEGSCAKSQRGLGYFGGTCCPFNAETNAEPRQVVREQCWLNEIINSVHWEPDVSQPDNGGPLGGADAGGVEGDATEAELQAVLEGTHADSHCGVIGRRSPFLYSQAPIRRHRYPSTSRYPLPYHPQRPTTTCSNPPISTPSASRSIPSIAPRKLCFARQSRRRCSGCSKSPSSTIARALVVWLWACQARLELMWTLTRWKRCAAEADCLAFREKSG